VAEGLPVELQDLAPRDGRDERVWQGRREVEPQVVPEELGRSEEGVPAACLLRSSARGWHNSKIMTNKTTKQASDNFSS